MDDSALHTALARAVRDCCLTVTYLLPRNETSSRLLWWLLCLSLHTLPSTAYTTLCNLSICFARPLSGENHFFYGLNCCSSFLAGSAAVPAVGR